MKFLAIAVVIFGQWLGPWLCCCRAATLSESTVKAVHVIPKCCQSCCPVELGKSQSPTPLKPCPVNCPILEDRPVNLERSTDQVEQFVFGLTIEWELNAVDYVVSLKVVPPEKGELIGLPMAVLRIKYHHCMRC